MTHMFYNAYSFNGDLSKWDVSKVVDMSSMFRSATSFNGDISKWDGSGVSNMDFMFWGAVLFVRTLCAAWFRSVAMKTKMFTRWPAFIAPCPNVPRRPYVSRRPLPERELIATTQIATSVSTLAFTSTTIPNANSCTNCGTFEKSGRASCCAPGGAWYKNCGGAGNNNADHRWFEGIDACKRTFI